MNYKTEKYEIAFNLLAMRMATDSVAMNRFKPYVEKIALLNRKETFLLSYVKVLVSENMSKVSFHRLQRHHSLYKYNEMFKKGQYNKAKLGYEKLIKLDSFYLFLKINIKLCDNSTTKGNKC